jgi:hypothetical protein
LLGSDPNPPDPDRHDMDADPKLALSKLCGPDPDPQHSYNVQELCKIHNAGFVKHRRFLDQFDSVRILLKTRDNLGWYTLNSPIQDIKYFMRSGRVVRAYYCQSCRCCNRPGFYLRHSGI